MSKMTKALAAAGIALLLGSPAVAQDKKVLKFAHVFPASHWHWNESFKLFEDEVAKATNGKVAFENYHAGQLGKEGVTMLQSGLADMAILVPSYEAAKLPLTSVAELPGLYGSSCEGTNKYWAIAKDGGALNNAEYKPLGIKMLYGIVLPPYQIMTTNRKVAALADVSGLKLRANGAAMDKTVRTLNGVPVRVTSNEFYDALTRGTVDGGLWPIGSTRTVGLEKVFKYTIQGPQLGSGSTFYAMSAKSWNALSPDVKDAITAASAKVQKHLCEWLDQQDLDDTAWLQKNHGLAVTTANAKELAQWSEKLAPIAESWAKDMDSTGRPGTALLKAFREAPSK